MKRILLFSLFFLLTITAFSTTKYTGSEVKAYAYGERAFKVKYDRYLTEEGGIIIPNIYEMTETGKVEIDNTDLGVYYIWEYGRPLSKEYWDSESEMWSQMLVDFTSRRKTAAAATLSTEIGKSILGLGVSMLIGDLFSAGATIPSTVKTIVEAGKLTTVALGLGSAGLDTIANLLATDREDFIMMRTAAEIIEDSSLEEIDQLLNEMQKKREGVELTGDRMTLMNYLVHAATLNIQITDALTNPDSLKGVYEMVSDFTETIGSLATVETVEQGIFKDVESTNAFLNASIIHLVFLKDLSEQLGYLRDEIENAAIMQDSSRMSINAIKYETTKYVYYGTMAGFFRLYKKYLQEDMTEEMDYVKGEMDEYEYFIRNVEYYLEMKESENIKNEAVAIIPKNSYGEGSYVKIISGNLSGQDITATNPEITVVPSEQLSGNFEISVKNAGRSGDIFPIVATPNWGGHETNYWCVASHQSPGIKTHTVNVDLTAPSTPGTYYLIIAAQWEMSCANIASGTNWTVEENHWNDGNDLAEWDEALIEEAIEKGIVIAEWELLQGMVDMYVPASAIKVHVLEGDQHTGWQHPGYDLSNTHHYPYPSQIGTNEFGVVWSTPTVGSILIGDLNGDNVSEIVSAYESKVSAKDKEGNELWSRNVASDSGISGARIHSMDLADMDSDGDAEVVVGISPAVPYPGVNKPLRILFYDDEGSLIKSISLPNSHVIDVRCADLDSDGEVEVIAAIYAWYTRKPRGIYVYEYSTGNELWHYDVGPQISIDAIADINNDGYKEIIIGSSAPHNGNYDNGTDDYHSYVFCFDKDGNNLWTKQIGYCGVRSSVADLDNDGTVEIISFHSQNHYYPNTNYVHILDPSSGDILHTYEGPYAKVWRGWAIADINNDNKKEIVVGNEDRKICVLDYNLNLLLSDSFEGAVQAINDINGDGKEEIIFCTEDNKIMILDNELNQLWSSSGGANSAIISDLIPGGSNEIIAVGEEGIDIFGSLHIMMSSYATIPQAPEEETPDEESKDIIVAAGVEGIHIFDVSDPTNPKHLSHLNLEDTAKDVYVKGDYVYVADEANGLVIVDVSNPKEPKRVGYYNTAGAAEDVYVKGDYAYLADGYKGLVIVDVSDPTNPQKVGHYNTADYAWNIYVKDDYAYVANYLNGLVVVDVSNPTKPEEVGHYDTAGEAWGVYVKDNYAYVADRKNGLVIVDISDLTNPEKVGHYGTAGHAVGVYVKDNYAYMADGENGLVVIDISNPTNPKQVGHCNTAYYAEDVYVKGDYAYVADGWNGLVIVEISDPENPTLAVDMPTFIFYGISGN